MTFSMERIKKARESGYNDDQIVEAIQKRDPEFGKRVQKARESGYDSSTIIQSIEKKFSSKAPLNNSPEPQSSASEMPTQSQEEPGYFDSFKKGLRSSASGEIANIDKKQEEEISKDPGFWKSLVQETGTIVGDSPYMLAGSTLGAAVGSALGSFGGPVGTGAGAVAGGGFGAFAFPEFIKTALQEYKDHVQKGNDLTFGEFLQRADKVGSKTLNSGLMGVILGSINKAAPLLQEIPGVGDLFKSKIAQKAATITGETAAVAGLPAISQGELPTSKDFAHALALVLGFNALSIPGAVKDKIQKRGEASGLSPEEFARSLSENDARDLLKAVDQVKDKIKPEEARNPIEKREPEKVSKSNESIESDLKSTNKEIEDLPLSNKKKLAQEAVKRGYVRTPDQLNLFLDEYEAVYPSIPGKTGLSKNRKFMNRYTEKNIEIRDIQPSNEKPVMDVRLSPERTLEIGRTQKREAKFEGDKTKLKEAQKRIDISKRKLEGQADQKIETPEEKIDSKQSHKDQIIDSLREAYPDIKLGKVVGKTQESGTTKNGKTEWYKDYISSVHIPEAGVTFTANGESVKESINALYAEIEKSTGLKPKTKENTLIFTTEKGSTYTVDGNKTTREKAYRPEHGKAEQGTQPTSEKTWYVTPEDANKLGEFQTVGSNKKIFEFSDGRLGIQYISGPNKGKVEARTVVTPKTEPKEGLLPVEIWKGGERVHFGNKIVSVKPSELSISKAAEKKVPEPIIETTGQGAEQRFEELPTFSSKLKEKATSVKEAVSNPTELLHQINTKAFDALEPINRLETGIPTAEKVTTKIKQAQSAASDVNNVLTKGVFENVTNKFESGSLRDVYVGEGDIWKKITKGLKEGEYSVREMDIYRASKEALKRQKQGKKSGMDTAISEQNVAKFKQKYGPVDQRLQEFQKKTLDHYGKNLLGKEVIGEWTKESHASLYRVMDYGKDAVVKEGSLAPKKPWYKAKGSDRKVIPPSESDIQNLSMLITNSKKNDSILQYKKLVEQGKLPGKIVKSKNKEMPSKMMEDLEIDPENEALAETLFNQSRKDAFTPETGRIKGWENGKPFEIEVPKDVYDTYASLAPSDTGMFTQIFKTTNNLMSRGIVLEPRKFLSIVGRDALSSLIYSKTGSNPISIVRALTDIYKDTKAWNQFKSLGGEQYVSRLMTRADRSAKIEELIKAETKAQIIPFNQLGKFLSEFNSKLAAAVPFAEYQRGVAKYGDTPSGRLQALIGAKEVTYDPTKKGSSKLVKDAANFFPFFNVMLQEPAMIAKNLKRREFIAKGIVGLTLPTLLLKMYNDGNPDYDDMNPLLKASCWHFYTKDGHYACPVPWLLGATFKAAPEALYDIAKNQGGDSWKGLYSFIASQLFGSFPPIAQAIVEQSTGKSLPSPVGAVLSPFTDVEKRAPEVVPKRLQSLPPEQQYTSKTSQLARWFGDKWKVSPVKLERLIKTFGGGVAADTLALIDEVAYQTGLAEDKRPEQGAKNYLILGNFFYENTPTNTKYATDFYSQLEQARLDKKREKPNNYKELNRYNTSIAKKWREYRDIENQKIDPKQKRDLLKAKQKETNALYKEAVTTKK